MAKSCEIILELVPNQLEKVKTAENLAEFKNCINVSLSLSTRDALLGDWNAIVSRVFDGEDILQSTLLETIKTVFKQRLEGKVIFN